MLVCFEKKIEKISKILLTILKVFKKYLEVLENFNKMYTIMFAFHYFSQRKKLYINCVHNRIFPKIWRGAKCITGPPSKIWGAMAPCPPPLWRTPWF